MKKITRRNFLQAAGVAAAALGLTACGASSTVASSAAGSSVAASSAAAATSTEYKDLQLGTDFTDLKADLKLITHRTDIIDTIFAGYVADFQKMYPNITITYEGITDYENDMSTRMTATDWGDICMLPTSLGKADFPDYFEPFGSFDELSQTYEFLVDKSFDGVCYGIPSVGNAQGVLYNKAVFTAAGITELPKTPDEFLDDLQLIKDNTDATPLYTNFAANWTMTAWDAYVGGSTNGDPDYLNNKFCHEENPFSDNGKGYGPYNLYKVLYEATARGLIEDDPTTTDWEGSKGMFNNGEIATMVLGSWAVVQMQEAGDHADDVGYMSFPITVEGKQYATAACDYNYAININTSDDNKLASKLYIKYLTEQSNFAYDQGGIPIVKGAEYPDTLAAFDGIELVVNNPAQAGEEDLINNLNRESELQINQDYQHVSNLVEAALNGKSFDDCMTEWNDAWTAAQTKYNA